MEPFDWECPHCNKPTTLTKERIKIESIQFTIANTDGLKEFTVCFYVCPNKNCKKFTLSTILKNLTSSTTKNPYAGTHTTYKTGSIIKTWQLIPELTGKNFPDYIPPPIIQDYNEACAIKELSPKASATLARRAIQTILRNFYNAKGSTLKDEITSVESKMEPSVVKAIDAVRKVGNIGAHMEKDINLIIDIDPNEAQLLIRLIEILLEETYIRRKEREENLESITKLGDEKSAKKVLN